MAYSDLPLVSRDYNGNPHSSIVDGLSTMVLDGKLAKIVCWYDNEWGYSTGLSTLSPISENAGWALRDPVLLRWSLGFQHCGRFKPDSRIISTTDSSQLMAMM